LPAEAFGACATGAAVGAGAAVGSGALVGAGAAVGSGALVGAGAAVAAGAAVGAAGAAVGFCAAGAPPQAATSERSTMSADSRVIVRGPFLQCCSMIANLLCAVQ
jgi:carbonic anhydrase/acetyltransferase-like protein (isoleucine patch superfamily)